jgi:Na+-driven multidrug efflux pump
MDTQMEMFKKIT